MRLKAATIFMLIALIFAGCYKEEQVSMDSEIVKIRQVIENSIGWAKTKDTTLLFSCFVPDSTLFFFNPDNAGNIHGFENFKSMTKEFFLNDAFKAIGHELKDLKIGVSQSGQSAWWSCYLDDFNEWNGRPANWVNVRWSGVLDKRDGRWLIAQMHFSHAIEDFQKKEKKEP